MSRHSNLNNLQDIAFNAPKKTESTNKNENTEIAAPDWRIPDDELDQMFGRLTPEERATFLRLYDKLLGRSVVEEGGGQEANVQGPARKAGPRPAGPTIH